MTTTTTAPAKAETEFPQVCRQCGEVMSSFEQENSPRVGGTTTYITCFKQGCLLHGVTLSVEQFNGLTEKQLEPYREMNRARGSV